MNVPILDTPKIDVALTMAILQEICESHMCYDPIWGKQTGNANEIFGLLTEIAQNGLFRSVRSCVNKVALHTLTLTLNLPQVFNLVDSNMSLFRSILEQLETIPSNRFYSDSVCFMNPKSRPKYCQDLKKFVKTYLCWVDIVKPQVGPLIPVSRFDTNLSTGKITI